jgi:glycosyltransferase involved in cell wall biosynthesis
MISICIPVYNFDVRTLVDDLFKQLQEGDEIVLIDDASLDEFKQMNATISNKYAQSILLENNVGRSKIRNLFLNYAKNDYLLFLDCDVQVISSDFLERYRNSIFEKKKLVCGGRLYPDICPSEQQVLRWKYGHQRESQNAVLRSQAANRSFMTNNFLIKRDLLERFPFDERLTQYGHEDTLLGIQLNNAGIKITHIENPILNGDIETNVVFMDKTERALQNLKQICTFYEDKQSLRSFVSLLKTNHQFEKLHLSGFLRLSHHLIGSTLKKSLIRSKSPSMLVFNFYKLLYYSSLK